jgi:hypothetical protein
MEIRKKFFPKVLLENENAYFAHLEGVINSVDEYSNLQITYTNYAFIFRLAPSLPKYIPLLIEEIIKFHNLYNIRLDFSKSIKTSGTIVFDIPIIK